MRSLSAAEDGLGSFITECGKLLPFHYSFPVFVVRASGGEELLKLGGLLEKCVWNGILGGGRCHWGQLGLEGVRRQDVAAQRVL